MGRCFLVPGALAVLLCACAQQAAPPAAARSMGRQCFLARDVNGYGWVPGGQAIDVRVGADRYYRLGLGAGCPFGKFSTRVALRNRSGSAWICDPLDAELFIPDPAGAQSCPVTSVQQLSKAEWTATRHQ